jgi:predicted DNA-binding ribbon-helix-helix protein
MAEEEGGGLLKKSLTIQGHRTSIALEQEFWEELEKLARLRGKSMPTLIAEIDYRRAAEAPEASLASSLRVFALLNRTERS